MARLLYTAKVLNELFDQVFNAKTDLTRQWAHVSSLECKLQRAGMIV
jgi:hypothetical protein